MLKQNDTGLIIVDVQGKLARTVHNSDALIQNLQTLIKGCQALNLPIIWLEQNPQRLGETVQEIKPLLENNQALAKFTFNACDSENVLNAIESSGVKQWLVAGIEAHICVYQTTSDLLARGFNVEVVEECISSRSLFNLNLSLQKMASKGVGITSVEMCLFELVGDARKDEFKKILPLIK